jgi:hypothetical protein
MAPTNDAVQKDAGGVSSENTVTRTLMLALGVLWIIDGILQLQPASFTTTLADDVLAPNLQGQPAVITSMVSFGIQFFDTNPFAVNLAAALVQVFIGFALVLRFSRPFKVFALYLSVAWALIVWIFGEAMGNIFTGTASFYTGGPGSVLLYLILTLFLLYPAKLTAKRLPFAAGAILLFGAILELFPTFWSESGVQSVFSLGASDSVAAIAGPAGIVSNVASQAPVVSNAVLVLLLAIFGGLLLIRPSRTLALGAGVFLVLTWWFCQDFGGIQTFPTSTATDPNSAIVMILFLIPLLVRPKQTAQADSLLSTREDTKSTMPAIKPRTFYTIVWLVLVGATLMEVFTRSLSITLSVIVLIIIVISCTKAALIALYYQGLRHEPWTLGLLPFVSFIIVALLAITSLLMASMGGMSGMSM